MSTGTGVRYPTRLLHIGTTTVDPEPEYFRFYDPDPLLLLGLLKDPFFMLVF